MDAKSTCPVGFFWGWRRGQVKGSEQGQAHSLGSQRMHEEQS